MNPYKNLPTEAFWRPAVAVIPPRQINKLWKPKFKLNKTQAIATAGSCFAQHISKALLSHGYAWLNGESAPNGLSPESQRTFNYGIFSFRTGNIYTAASLRQWLEWALTDKAVSDEIWTDNDRFFDPFRPAIEPHGFYNRDELLASRNVTLDAIRSVFEQSQYFIFTLGLTEAWLNTENNSIYPMCPGTVAGQFDAKRHRLINYTHQQTQRDLRESFRLIKTINPNIKFLLTVSPVPLTATASKKHVLVATTYSKSTLRSVAGEMANTRPDTDYFPSYELITSVPFRGLFFEENLRNVTQEGIDFVMTSFFSCLGDKPPAHRQKPTLAPAQTITTNACPPNNCEEVLLDAFRPSEDQR